MPLLAAGPRSSSREHIEKFTANLREVFIDLDDTASLAMLDRDVRSAELYYREHCYKYLLYKHRTVPTKSFTKIFLKADYAGGAAW